MTMQSRLYQLLTTSPRPVPAVGDRFYKTTAPQSVAEPYGVFHLISRDRLESHDEQPLQNLRCWRIQISIFSASYATAAAALGQVLGAIAGYHDSSGIDSIALVDQREFWEEDTKLFHHSADFEVWESLS